MKNRITSLTLHRFRNVEPGTTLRFNEKFNVLLGKNATGKTTLLRLLVAIASGDFEQFEDEPFDITYVISAPFMAVRADYVGEAVVRIINAPAHEPTRSVVDSKGIGIQTLSIEFRPDGRPPVTLDATEDSLRIQTEGRIVKQVPRRRLHHALDEARSFNEQFHGEHHSMFSWLWPTLIWRSTKYLDESTNYFDSALDSELIVSTFGLGFSLRNPLPDFMTKTSLLPTPGASTFQVASKTNTFLGALAKTLDVVGLEIDWALQKMTQTESGPEWIYGPPRFRFELPNGNIFGADGLSYGQKRMLAFKWYMDSSKRFVACDELVNGLHHAWIEACIKEIEGRQAVLTSQNPLLLDYLEFESVEKVRESFVLCSKSDSGKAQWTWRNPTEREADAFFEAYKTGFQRVSDILITNGLW